MRCGIGSGGEDDDRRRLQKPSRGLQRADKSRRRRRQRRHQHQAADAAGADAGGAVGVAGRGSRRRLVGPGAVADHRVRLRRKIGRCRRHAKTGNQGGECNRASRHKRDDALMYRPLGEIAMHGPTPSRQEHHEYQHPSGKQIPGLAGKTNRHPEVAAKRPSKDAAEAQPKSACRFRILIVVALGGSLRSHLRVTGN